MNIHPTYRPLILLVVATTVVLAIFFDVVFLKASLQPSNIYTQIGAPTDYKTHSFFTPLNPATTPAYGYNDLGASAWQSEPARYLMARNFRENESPFWNIYSAAGTIGPETLVDIKFSPFTLLSAFIFNSSPESFDYGLILIYILGVFCVLLILHNCLQLSLIASFAGAITYLLNGFAISNLNSHMGQPYFFAPLLLYSLLFFTKKPTLYRWIFLTGAHAVMLMITFLPTLLLTLLTTHILNLAYFFHRSHSIKNTVQYFVLLGGTVFFGLMLTAPLWFPIIDSFYITDTLTDYSSRDEKPGLHYNNLLSLFTPKHFWENYTDIIPRTIYPKTRIHAFFNIVSYNGIIALIIAGYAANRECFREKKIVGASLVLFIFSYGRIFYFEELVNYIPVINNIGFQYWGCISAICLIILVAHGIDNIQSKKITSFPAILVLIILAIVFVKFFTLIGSAPFPYKQYVVVIIFLFFISCFIIFIIKKLKAGVLFYFVPVFIVLMTLELMFYMNTLRPIRFNPIEKQPEFVSFLKENIKDARVISMGNNRTLYPEYGAMYGIKQIDTQNPALLLWYEAFYRRHFGTDTWLFLTLGNKPEKNELVLKENILTEAALDIANVKYILVVENAKQYIHFFDEKKYPVVFKKDGLNIFENTDHMKTATLVPTLILSSQIPEAANFNPGISVVSGDTRLILQAQQLGIPVLPNINQAAASLQGTTQGATTVLSYHNTEIIMETQSMHPAILALSEVWHPNWKATVDGQDVYVGRINEAFRGIALPAGAHRIRMYYESAALRYGIDACIAAVLILLSLLIYSSIKNRYGIKR